MKGDPSGGLLIGKNMRNKSGGWHERFGFALILVAAILLRPMAAWAAEAYVPFEGEKTAWHDGFDRYDYVMDEETCHHTLQATGHGEFCGG